MGTSKSQPNDWMLKNGTGKITTFADERGWCIQHADGQIEVIHAMSDVAESPAVATTILSVVNPSGDYSLGAGAEVLFAVNWSEPVIVTGTPQISFEENNVGVTADYDSARSTSTQSVFVFDVTAEGAIDTITESVQLNSGTIIGADAVDASFSLVFSADTVSDITVTTPGTGFDESETITIDAPNKANSTATITTTDAAGVVDSVVLEYGGYGYEAGTIVIAGGTSGTVTATVVDGVITAIVLLAGGTGYTGASGVELAVPTLTVTQATADLVFADDAVSDVTMTEVGYGYDGLEGYTVDSPTGTDAILTFNADYAQPTGVTVVA